MTIEQLTEKKRIEQQAAKSQAEVKSYSDLGLSDDFLGLVRSRAAAAESEAEMKALKDGLNKEITALLAAKNVDKCRADIYKVAIMVGETRTLSREKLLLSGVSLQTLEESTNVTPWSSLRVTDTTKPRKTKEPNV